MLRGEDQPCGTVDLSPGQVHVWYCATESLAGAGVRQACLDLLDEAEKVRYYRFLREEPRLQFLLGRVLMRSCLAGYLKCGPEELAFELSTRGKPYLAGGRGRDVRFNLSHSLDEVALAVTRTGEVGMDLEHIDPARAESGIARRFFSAAENRDLERLAGAEYVERFFRIWTLKEAYLKATGEGITEPLDSFRFALGEGRGGGTEIDFSSDRKEQPDRWRFRSLRLGPTFMLAIAARCDPGIDLAVLLRPCVPRLYPPQQVRIEIIERAGGREPHD